VDGIMLRANSHKTITTLAHNSDVPVINGLTDYNHPCQIMADLQTLEERGGDLSDMTLTWVGDGNNVAVSFINAAGKFGYKLRISCPEGYTVPSQTIEEARDVNDALMTAAAKDAIFLHCLPAHRGEEVTASVIDGPQSAVFDEAENRLHAQKAVIRWCLEA